MRFTRFGMLLRFCFCAWMYIGYTHASAQCSGNVLFRETFGGDANSPVTGPALSPSVTSYVFEPDGLVDDGEYSIRKTTANLATNQPQFLGWHVGNDNTGNGYMMIVNASFAAGKFYETRVDNLCAGTKLYFSAMLANLISISTPQVPLDPIVKFEIRSAANGALLGLYTTPALKRYASLNFEKHGMNFTVPSGETSVILSIYNNQPGGNGNDLCLDDIEFTVCAPTNNPSVNGGYPNTGEVCLGTNISLASNITPGFYQNPAYQWQRLDANSSWIDIAGATAETYAINNVQPSHAGTYRLLMAETGYLNSPNCRSFSKTIHMVVFSPVVPVVNTNSPLCLKQTITLSSPTFAYSYAWTDAAGAAVGNLQNISIPATSTSQSGSYKLSITGQGGCKTERTFPITVLPNNLQSALPGDTVLCNNESIQINAAVPPAISFLWNNGGTSPIRIIKDSGLYTITTSDGICKRNDSMRVVQLFTPPVKLPPDTTICKFDSLLLNVAAPGIQTYLWNTGSNSSSIVIQKAGIYAVTVQNRCGAASDEIKLETDDCSYEVFVPTSFTPNNDGLNDMLKAISFYNISGFELHVYNRWGQEIFRTNNINKGWDGTMNGLPATTGAYSWKIKWLKANKPAVKTGTVLLIR